MAKEENKFGKVLYLPIKQKFFDEILNGTKTQEFREVKPTTIKKLLQLGKDGFEVEDENGNSLPIIYNTLWLRCGMDKVADEMHIAVKNTEVQVLQFLLNDNGQYLTNDAGGLIVYDEELEDKFGEKNEDGTPKVDENGERILLPHAPFEYVTDKSGHIRYDEKGVPTAPEFDENGNCTNGLLWVVQQVVYTLGKILDKKVYTAEEKAAAKKK